jgi:ERCC4-type nuclease
MLILDDREPRDLLEELKKQDIDVCQTRLEFGDCCFEGLGPSGSCLIGIERKRLSDLISSMRDKRLSGHQLRGMRISYEYLYLFVEGVWRPGGGGGVEELRGRDFRPVISARKPASYRQVDNFLSGQELRGGVIVRRTGSVRETATQWADLYHNFQKSWDKHNSHDAVYAPDPNEGRKGGRVRFNTTEATYCFKFAAQLPGIDHVIAQRVAEHFGSFWAASNAPVKEWLKIKGVGKVIAETARQVIRGVK